MLSQSTNNKNEAVLSPQTTAEQNRVAIRQMRINLIWEVTQSLIALSVTTATIYTAMRLALLSPGESAAFLLMSNSFFLVIGFYFGRTNHQKTGGVGHTNATEASR